MIGLNKKLKLPDIKKKGKNSNSDSNKNKIKSSTTKVISIDNYSERYYKYENSTIFPFKKLVYSNTHLNITYIANKDMIIAPIELSKGIPEDSIDGALEDKAYEELGLDPAVEYTIKYMETEVQESENRVFQMFIMEEDRYYELFMNLRESIKYVDFIVPAPLLYKTLYEYEILEKNQIHCFLYFTQKDATITFYKNGEYLYSKSINYSLQQIYDRYCEFVGKTVDEKEFFQIFQKEGVKTNQIEYQQNFIKLFNEIFITINDIIIYTKRAYKIEIIDQMYIGSDIGPISGIEEYAQNYLGLYAIPMVFDFGIDTNEWYIDQYHFMMILTVLRAQEKKDNPEIEYEVLNFTKYPRPPVFYKRPSGQFAISITVALLVASAYPMYFLVYAYMNELVIYQKKKEDEPLAKEVAKYKAILAQKTRTIKKLDKILKNKREKYIAKEKTLEQVYKKKIYYRLQSEQLALFAQDMKDYKVKTNQIESNSSNYHIRLISEDDDKITKFVKRITHKYDKELKYINIPKIYKDDKSSMYMGNLEVDLK